MKHDKLAFRKRIEEAVREFRSCFALDLDHLALSNENTALHESLKIEELTELVDAKTRAEQLDAIVDSIYVTQGEMCHRVNCNEFNRGYIDLLINVGCSMGFDVSGAFEEVHASNMSKICISMEEAIETKNDYEVFKGYKSVEMIATGDGYIVRNEFDCKLPCGKVVKAGKTLKSLYYREANLKDFI